MKAASELLLYSARKPWGLLLNPTAYQGLFSRYALPSNGRPPQTLLCFQAQSLEGLSMPLHLANDRRLAKCVLALDEDTAKGCLAQFHREQTVAPRLEDYLGELGVANRMLMRAATVPYYLVGFADLVSSCLSIVDSSYTSAAKLSMLKVLCDNYFNEYNEQISYQGGNTAEMVSLSFNTLRAMVESSIPETVVLAGASWLQVIGQDPKTQVRLSQSLTAVGNDLNASLLVGGKLAKAFTITPGQDPRVFVADAVARSLSLVAPARNISLS